MDVPDRMHPANNPEWIRGAEVMKTVAEMAVRRGFTPALHFGPIEAFIIAPLEDVFDRVARDEIAKEVLALMSAAHMSIMGYLPTVAQVDVALQAAKYPNIRRGATLQDWTGPGEFHIVKGVGKA